MSKKKNIFIEGIPGSGKTTLLDLLCDKMQDYTVYHEGDISPVELAWCSYMSKEQYELVINDFPDMATIIQDKTVLEGEFFIVSYTKIQTTNIDFYRYMERFEIYGGRKNISDFKEIILQRFSSFHNYGNIFECSFFQNIIEELMLFAEFDDLQIINFYIDIMNNIDMDSFLVIRIVSNNIEDNILQIKNERVNEKGEEVWYQMMINYLNQSPYGQKHPYANMEDVLSHFKRRIAIENKIIHVLKHCIEVESKKYDFQNILNILMSNADISI